MKVAVVALACTLRFATSASAAEIARPSPLSLLPAAQAGPVVPPPRIDTAKAGGPAKPTDGTTKLKADAPPRDAAKPRQDNARQDSARRARVCFNPAETRENIATHRLAEPFRALRLGRQQGEALRAKLCRWKRDEFVYEISVLRRDGRIVRLYMNAQSGQAVGALDDNDRH